MYLIDGNNVMGQRVGWHRDKPAARKRLLEDLARLAWARKTRLAVVFDGRPDQAFPDGSSYRGVRIYYAAPGRDADSRIVELVEGTRNKKNLTVVTSDGQLKAQVRVRGVRVVRSGAFRRMMDETEDAGPPNDHPRINDDEMDGWMRYFGISEDDDDDDHWQS